MTDLSIDFETRSDVPLRKAGVYRYVESKHTDVLCMAWFLPGITDEVRLWTPGQDFPPDIAQHIWRGGMVRAWNAPFERALWDMMNERGLWPGVASNQWVCTLSEARAMGLPGHLEACAKVLDVPHQKDKRGKRLIDKYSVPRRRRKSDTGPGPFWFELEGEDRDDFFEYCKQDVRVEMDIARAVNRLVPSEREVWLRCQRKNDRGIGLDHALISAGIDIVGIAEERANAELAALTEGAVGKVTQRNAIIDLLTDNDIYTDSLDKRALQELLSRDLPSDIRRVLELRHEVARSSVAKLHSMQHVASTRDGRARGLLEYYGASTGREAGRLVQPQNFARGDDVPGAEMLLPLVLDRQYDAIDSMYPPVAVVSALLRGCLVPSEGCDLLIGDYSAIEARVVDIMAGQEDAIELWREYDRTGSKEFEPYTVAASRFYRIDWRDVRKFPERQLGKVIILGSGFGAGGPKLATVARDTYGLTDVTDEQGIEMRDFYRATHPRVVQWWYDLQGAAMAAVRSPGSIHEVGEGPTLLRFTMRGPWLMLALPTGRILYYAQPSIVEREVPWSTPEKPETRPGVRCWGMSSYTRQWESYDLYGGLLAENVAQAIARDIMMGGEAQLEAAGYAPVLTVHDELVTEQPLGFGSAEEFARLMVPDWCRQHNWPIAGGEVIRCDRYRK